MNFKGWIDICFIKKQINYKNRKAIWIGGFG